MAVKAQIKANQLAKDLNIKSKDIVDIMAEKEEMTEENETAFVPITQLVSEEKPVRKRTRKAKVIEPVVSEDVPDSPDADAVKTEKKKKAEKVDVSTIAAPGRGGRNSNERILELHKAGKSNMAIAKELGLGIGEVKLVIDLFEGI